MKRIRNLLKVAMKSILKNRMRSLLTSLGIIIGVGAVIVMVGIGAGAQADIQAQIASMGVNMVMIMPGAGWHGGASQGAGSFNRLTMKDAQAIADQATLVTAVSPYVRTNAQVIGGEGNWNTTIEGVWPDYLAIRAWKVGSGEFFTDRDVRAKSKVAVLGQTIVNELFPNQDPIGQKIRIGNTPFHVIGVLESKGQSSFGQDQDDVVMVPATTALYRLAGGQYIDRIYASARSIEDSAAAEEELAEIMRVQHRLHEGEDDDFHVRNQAEFMEMATSTQKVMTLLLGAVAAVSLIVGGIGIMNIMLVSVTERTREIGIRLAVGAHSSDVLAQFLVESVILCLIGGLVGIAAGLGTGQLLANLMGVEAVLDAQVIVLATAFSAAVGVFFGFYPARKASRLDPIEALRYE
jgi:putative ABC transport system permease protein